jgi:hypothetical protein
MTSLAAAGVVAGGVLCCLALVQGPEGEPHPPDEEPGSAHPADEKSVLPCARDGDCDPGPKPLAMRGRSSH